MFIAVVIVTWFWSGMDAFLNLTRAGEVIEGALWWIEVLTVGALVWTRDREGSRRHERWTVIAVVLPFAAQVLAAPFARGYTWAFGPLVALAAMAILVATNRRRSMSGS